MAVAIGWPMGTVFCGLFTVPFIKKEKSRKKVLTNTGTGDNIMKLSDRDSKKHKASIERLKEIKKVVDKLQKQ